jgi:signal transduction histidine kinase
VRRLLLACRWTLFDVALAAGLLIATVETMEGYEDDALWLFAPPIAAALVIRRRFPKSAVLLAGVAALLHHLDPNIDIQPMDLAVPLTVYTLAGTARQSRRVALAGLAAALVAVSLVSAVQVIGLSQDKVSPTRDDTFDFSVTELPRPRRDGADEAPRPPLPEPLMRDLVAAPTNLSDLVAQAVGRALSILLVIALAFAIGDGVRSRRAYLTTLEKRAADLEREQRQRVALSLAAERARITRELHDVVAHALSVMVVQAQGAAAALRRHPDRTEAALQNVITTGRGSLAEMRRLLDLVRQDPAGDPARAPQPGVDALPELIDGVRAAGTPVTFTVEGDPVPLPLTVDLSAYRIAQEALTNTIKHAGGTGVSARVRIAYRPDEIELEVSDDGQGPGTKPNEGNGLRGIAERVSVLGGELSVGSSSPKGFRVKATLPLRPKGMTA